MTTFVLGGNNDFKFMKRFTQEYKRQVPYSIAQAMNTTAVGSRFAPETKTNNYAALFKKDSRERFERPKAQSADLFMQQKAKKRNLEVRLAPKTKPWSRNRYISGNVFGNSRAPKPWEVKIVGNAKTNLQVGTKFVPTNAVKLDKFGNVPLSLIKAIESDKKDVLVGRPKYKARRPGIWLRSSSNNSIKPLFVVSSASGYRQLLQPGVVLEDAYKSNFMRNFRQELLKNVRSGRNRG